MSIYYKHQLCLNCLCKDLKNAQDIMQKMEGHVLIGLLSADYESVDAAIKDMQTYQKALNGQISVGLGGGNPKQWQMAADIASQLKPAHVNQIFSAVGYTRAQCENSHINALVSPSGIPGLVKISTGPISSDCEAALIPVETAIAMIREMGGNSLKFYPMNGLKYRDELIQVAKACAQTDFILEPTGGITTDNLEEILTIILDAGVKQIIPHVYTSIMDENGYTKLTELEKIAAIFKKLV